MSAVGEIAAVRGSHAVVAGPCADEVGPVSGVHPVVAGERPDLVRLLGSAQHVVARCAVDHGRCGDGGDHERRERGCREPECLDSHHVLSFVVDGWIDRHMSLGPVSGWKALGKPSVRTTRGMDADGIRARALVEESREAVVVLDDDDRVVLASRRARQSIDGVREGDRLPPELLAGGAGVLPFVVPYEVDGRRERLVYFSREGDLAAYEELRSGFTAAVSHELRTPLARLLTLLETATLPGEDVGDLVEQATKEVEQITELIDEVLFLSELESGARVVSLGATPVRPVLEEALDELGERAARAGVALALECEPESSWP